MVCEASKGRAQSGGVLLCAQQVSKGRRSVKMLRVGRGLVGETHLIIHREDVLEGR